MRSWVVRGALVLTLVSLGVTAMAPAAEEREKQLTQLLSLAVDRFEQGRWVEAKAQLDKVQGMDPTNEECWKLREIFGDRVIRTMATWMREGRTLGKAPMTILVRAQEKDQAALYNRENIRKNVDAVVKTDRLPQANLERIHMVGQRAVPALVHHLKSGRSDTARTNASYLLMHLGPQVVMPLTKALRSDDEMLLQHVCYVLARMRPRDKRALPQLAALYEDVKNMPAVREAAKKAIEAITGKSIDNLASADELYYREANRLYQSSRLVQEEMDDLDGLLWVWTGDKLEYVEVPVYELDDLLAQELCYEALARNDGAARFTVLLASSFMKQAVEITQMRVILDRKTEEHPNLADEQADFRSWQARLFNNTNLAYTIGSDLLLEVLDKALLDGQVMVAVDALTGVEEVVGKDGWPRIANWTRPSMKSEAPTVNAKLVDDGKEPKESPAETEKTACKKVDLKKVDLKKEEAKKEGAKKEGASEAEEPTPVVETPAPKPVFTNPVLAALDHPNVRVRLAAANCLMHIGLPIKDPAYLKSANVLIEGAQQDSQQVVLIVSNDAKLRERMAGMLEKENVLVMTAPSGREGLILARQYPPKDCIILDSEINEFDRLQDHRKMHNHVSGSPLPLVIVTARHRVDAIYRQFPESMWDVHVRTNIASDRPNLYDQLYQLQRFRKEKQVLVILTQEEREERERIRRTLQLEAERRGRPQRQSELLKLMAEENKKLLSDIFPTRNTFVNIFVDEDLSGYHAMRTVQEIRRYAITAKVPVALMATEERIKRVGDEFERYAENPADLRILDVKVGAKDLIESVRDMTKLNPLSKKNYVRILHNRLAEESAETLNTLNPEAGFVPNEAQIDGLREVLRTTLRPIALREKIADLFSTLKANRALPTLDQVFREEDKKNVELRCRCMRSLGLLDVENKFAESKVKALNDPKKPIRREGAIALAIGDATVKGRYELLKAQRPNGPTQLLSGKAPALVDEPDTTPAEQPADEPQADPEDQPGDKPADKPEDKPADKPADKEPAKGDWDSGW